MNKKNFVLGIIAGFGLLILLFSQYPDNKLHLVFCDVGQGDGILISQGFNQVLIDAGPDNKILSCLAKKMPFWDRKIELVVLTHPEKDHFGGLIEVLKRFKVEKILTNQFVKESQETRQLLKMISDQKIYTFFPKDNPKINIGKISFDTIWPSQSILVELESLAEKGEKLNNFFLIKGELIEANQYSIVLKLSFVQFDALLTGDLPREASQQLAWKGQLPLTEVVKAPHHGSAIDNPLLLYQETQPKLVVISVGKNPFGHPSEKLISQLQDLGIKVLRTDQGGTVEIISDGERFWRK